MTNTDSTLVLYIAAGVVMLLIVPFFLHKADRKRITRQIEAGGGRVIEILWSWDYGSRYERTYNVTYITARGIRLKATCRTNMNGVHWISDIPPGGDDR